MIYTTCKTIKIFFWLNIKKLYKCITISRSICSKGFTISEASEDLQITAEVRLEKNMLANFPNLCQLSYKVLYMRDSDFGKCGEWLRERPKLYSYTKERVNCTKPC